MPELSNRQKAAAVLLSVDSETAAAVLKNLPDGDIAVVTREMHGLRELGSQAATAVLHEFSLRAGEDPTIESTPESLRERLELAMGHDAARSMLQDIGVTDNVADIFHPIQELNAEDIYKLLADEHPQAVAVVLANIEAKRTASVLALFSLEAQVDIIRRMARSRQADESMLKRVGDIIRNKSGMFGDARKTPEDPRYKKVAEVINLLGQNSEDQILKQLTSDSPDMVKKLREMMFVFEDLLHLSDTDMRKVLMSIDTQLLAMSLKTASDALKEKVFSNLSRRAAETVTEELELLGPKPLSQVRAAQQQVVETVRKMNGAGEINIRGAKTEEDPLV